VPLGFDWPKFAERFERLEEAVKIIRLLWTQDFVTYNGKYYKLRVANLYTKPKVAVPLYIAGHGKTATSLAGRVGDGFLCGGDKSLLTQLEEAAIQAGRDPRKIRKRTGISLSYDEDYEKALQSVSRWTIQGTDDPSLSKFMGRNLYDPREMDRIAEGVNLREYAKRWLVCTNLEEVLKRAESISKDGFDEIEIYSCSPDERSFLTKFGTKYLPYLLERYSVE
jgi:coenzyme F420-dependent glucose-6-phosphate dehydrogenase